MAKLTTVTEVQTLAREEEPKRPKTLTITEHGYVPSSPAVLSQGNKGNRRPKNAFAGGYGTYLTYGLPPVVPVLAVDEYDGEYQWDAYPELKRQLYGTGQKLTKKRVDQALDRITGIPFKYCPNQDDGFVLPPLF